MKKVLIAFSVVIVTLFCFTAVFAAEVDDSGMWEYQPYGSGIELTGYNGDQTDVYVPNIVEKDGTEYSVLKLGDELFKDNTSLNSATLGEGIVEIGASVFEDATNMVCIVTPETLTTIGDNAFSGCTSFNSVILYDAVTTIGDNAFAGCDKLTIYCNENTAGYNYAVDNDIAYKILNPDAEPEIYVLDGITYYIMNGEAIAISVDYDLINVTIPAMVAGYPVTEIGEVFKEHMCLTRLTLPESIKAIEEYAFYNCSALTNVVLPQSIISIEDYAFSGCHSLENIILHDGIEKIGKCAFRSCHALEVINIPSKVSSIEEYSFSYCQSLRTIDLSKSIETIDQYAFYYCSELSDITFSDKLTTIGVAAFKDCHNIKEIIVPAGVKHLSNSAFASCINLTDVILSEGIEAIEHTAFNNCKNLKNVSFPSTLKSIDEFAFASSALVNVKLPDNLMSIGKNCFLSSSNLESVIIPASVTTIGTWAFGGCSETLVLYCYPDTAAVRFAINEAIKYMLISEDGFLNWNIVDGALSITGIGAMPEYTSSALPEWHEFTDEIVEVVIAEGITSVGNYAFYNLPNIKTVSIPDSVISIGVSAFQNSGIETIDLSNGVLNIWNYAFAGCKNLKEIVLPDSTQSIGDFTFAGCTNLQSFIGGEQLEKIGRFAFNNCSSLSKFVVQKNLKKFGIDIFYHCDNLKTAGPIGGDYNYQYGWMEEIPAYAFARCPVVSVTLPNTIVKINDSAFGNCGKLEQITIPTSVTSIHGYAFYHCYKLTISCYYLSRAYTYAIDNSINYVLLDDNVPTIGSSGPNSTWRYEDNVLYIEGVGELTEWGQTPEWEEYKKDISSIVISEGITSIGSYAFFSCGELVNITIPSTVSSIGDYAFSNCKKLESICIPDGIEYIPDCMFRGCSNLMRVTIPASVSKFGGNVFYDCSGLKTAGPIGGDYHYQFGWTEEIPPAAFNDCSGLTTVFLPDSIKVIGQYAFSDCFTLSKITLPSNLTTISQLAFHMCASLREIVIPSSVTRIDSSAFAGCSKLQKIAFSNNSSLSIGYEAFRGCTMLNIISIDSLENWLNINNDYTLLENIRTIYIEDKLLEGTLFIPEGIKEISGYAFYNYNKIKNVIIPQSVNYIGYNAFANCTDIEMVIIPQNVSRIYPSAFSATTILCVYENSKAHTVAVDNDLLYFVLRKTENPEISYGTGISGTVKYTDGTAVAGVNVEILYDDGTVKETVTTDADGNYAFTYAEVGRYTVRVTDASGNTASEVVSVKRMNVFDVYVSGETDLVLKKGYTVSGTVSDKTAAVTISDEKGNIIASIETTDGTFAFANIPRGTYIVKAETSVGSATVEIYVSNEDVTGIMLEVAAQSATITGDTKIENRDGTTSAKIWVNVDLIDENGNVIGSTKTDADGKYTFANVSLGSYNIVATTNEIRTDIIGGFDKNHELKGYGHIDVTEFIEYIPETIILREEKVNLTSVSGKVTANGVTQDCQVILTDENGDQIAVFVTDNNGKYSFVNIPDGMYCITAITKNDGMGFVVVTIKNGVVHGDTDIKVAKADKISKREPVLMAIPDCETKEEALIYKEAVMAEKAFYDSLSDKERKQLSEEWIEKLFELIGLISDVTIDATEGVTVENIESVISPDEVDETIEFTLTVTETTAADAGKDGITTEEEYETEKIKDKKGKDKEIAKYYDITFSKDGKNISNILKQTDTNGKLRITMEIPEEYRGHKHYSFIHMHKGEAVTLVDLDDDPDTVTFEIDKFSTFALAYSDKELIEEVPGVASVFYSRETGKISVIANKAATLYVATYDGDRFKKVDLYSIPVGTTEDVCSFGANQKAFVWGNNAVPFCQELVLEN